MARRLLRFLAALVFAGGGLAIFRKASAKGGGRRRPTSPRAGGAGAKAGVAGAKATVASPKATAASPKRRGRTSGSSPRLPIRRTIWVATILLFAGAVTFALFSQTSANSGNTYAASSDWKAPTVDRAVIQRNGGPNASAGYVKQGQVYYVYANVSDTGNPASGVSSVTANVCNVTSTSCGSVAMSSGSYTVNGVSYNYRSTSTVTADNPLSEGSKGFSITAADNNSNSATNSGFSVTVDNTGPAVSTIACGGVGCTSDYVGAGKTYYIYAQVTDSASGVDTVTTDPRNITASASATTSMSTSGGPWTIGGTSYNYRSIQLTADSGLTNGSTKSYTVTATDNVTNGTTPTDNATVDNTAPTVPTPVLHKGFGNLCCQTRAGASYSLYTDPSDASSGVDTNNVTADVDINASNTITTGNHSVPMCYSAAGYGLPAYGSPGNNTYHYKSDADGSPCDGTLTTLTADSGLPNGNRTFNVTVKDNAGNSATASKGITIDNDSGTAANATFKNASGGTGGKLEQNDTIKFGFNDAVDPESVLSGWDGAGDSTGNVVVRLTDGGGTCVASSDQLQVWNAANTAQTNLGTVCLGGTGYNTSGSTITFGATGTASSMAQTDFTAGTVVTLGTQSAAAATQSTDTTAVWTPTASLYDAAGNAYLTTSANTAIDNTVPTISATRICGGASCSADYVGAGKTYYIYANASDVTSPALTVTANVAVSGNVITTGGTSVTLSSCSSNCNVNGTTYAYKSAQQTADSGLADASTKSWTLTVKDGVLNQSTANGTATVDNTAPTMTTTEITKTFGRLNGAMKASGNYYLYADLSDSASAIDTGAVTVDASQLTSGRTSVPMCYSASGYSVPSYGDPGTTTYHYKSDSDGTCDGSFTALTADSGLANGSSKTWTISFDDNANNAATGNKSVGINNTSDAGTNIEINNASAGITGRLEQNDTIVFTFADSVDPESILSGWLGTGSNTTGNVVVRLIDGGGTCVASSDQLQVWNAANTAQTNLGTVCLGGTGYNTSGSTITFGATGTKSNMVQGCLTTCTTVTLGTQSVAAATQAGNTTAVWTPSASAYDGAGNAYLTTNVSKTIDNTAPTVSSSAIAKSSGTGLYLSGKIKQGGTYYVYANASDANSGLATVTANVNNITTGQTSVTLTAGSYSVNGTSYNYRSAALTANGTLSEGAKTYSVTATDNDANSTTNSTFSVTVDNTAPTANTTTKVAATNQTGTVSKPDVGDKIVYTYSEQIDPESILAGWTGASTNVTVRLNNNTACPSSANANDNITIFNTGNTAQLPLGCIDLATTSFVTANVTIGQSGSTTLSTMSQSGAAITDTLGSTTGTVTQVTGTRNMVWWPSASAFDAAGNAETTTSQAETDTDTDF
jgi:hypothetical protein